jgi:hypothetical protein
MILGFSIYNYYEDRHEVKGWVQGTNGPISLTEHEGTLETCREELIRLVTMAIKNGEKEIKITQP